MKDSIIKVFFLLVLFHQSTWANPYWEMHKVPHDKTYTSSSLPLPPLSNLKTPENNSALDILRVQVDWHEANESYQVSKMIIEPSGTENLLSRKRHRPLLGSYLGILRDLKTNEPLAYDSIGTGKEYRKLARAINLRFPPPKDDTIFELLAENPQSGVMEKVVSQIIPFQTLKRQDQSFDDLEIKEIAKATQFPSVRVNLYAEGYLKNEKTIFWQHAMKTVQTLLKENFPGVEHMSFYGVFHSSNQKLGKPQNLGRPIPHFDSFLGLYYPYWNAFGRWYHVVYPTDEDKFRQGLAAAPYDYPLVLINSDDFWGVGNYLSHTAIPAANTSQFTYLLLHELGHFFGLNEEYEGGGRTELEFAPGIREPWSQNLTFLSDPSYEFLKWNEFVDPSTQLPTPKTQWQSSPPLYGAYKGGYADSPSTQGQGHKPGLNCVMEKHSHFCDICTKAILEVIQGPSGH